MFETVAPFLASDGALFKATATLDELAKLNSGLWYGYTQVGKAITIYPVDNAHFSRITAELRRILPPTAAAPAVPFDHNLVPGSNIYVRYGAFVTKTNLTRGSGMPAPAILAPNGNLVPDRRDISAPDWAVPPVPLSEWEVGVDQTPLPDRYRVFRSISQRGKGGVYEAIDTGVSPPRRCIIKEGRKNGETAWDGRDGSDRIENETNVLIDLHACRVGVPRVLDTFKVEDNAYVVLEKLSGSSLHHSMAQRKRRLSIRKAISFGKQVAGLVAKIHSAGWVWRDCKPANLLVTNEGSLRPIDFEGACPIARPDPLPWTTPNFAAPEIFGRDRRKNCGTNGPEDLYALGVCLFMIFEGRLPHGNDDPSTITNKQGQRRVVGGIWHCSRERCDCGLTDGHVDSHLFSRRSIPKEVQFIIKRLLCRNAGLRPSAAATRTVLKRIEGQFTKKIREASVISDRIK